MLTVHEIDVFYNEFQALFGVSIEVSAGETVAIIGANGAGKTTLLRTIAGVLLPQTGSVHYRNQSLTGKPAFALTRQGIALVPEGRRIFPSLSVEENLRVGAYAGRKGEWTLAKIYELFPTLKERAHNGGTEISGGQQQMVAIGRALMSNPELILMDEISLGLAPVVIRDLYEVVAKIVRQGTTVILVEQDVSRVLKAADRVYCLLEGRVSLTGKPTELTQQEISRAYFGI